jgi:hypothetical protein
LDTFESGDGDEEKKKGFFDEERRLDKSQGIFRGIVGIVGSEIASSAQLKGEEELVAGIGGSKIGIGIGIGMGIDSEIVGIGGSVCMDMDADEGRGIIV